MIEDISYSYKGRRVSVDQLKDTLLEADESLRYHPLLGYRIIKKIEPNQLSRGQAISYKIGYFFFSLLYGRNSVEAAKNAWQKLEEETEASHHINIQVKLIFIKQSDFCLSHEVKSNEYNKLRALLKTAEEVSLTTKEILKKLCVAIPDGESIKDEIQAFLEQNQQKNLRKTPKSKVDELKESKQEKRSTKSLEDSQDKFNLEHSRMIEERIKPRSFEEFTPLNQNVEQRNSTLEDIKEKESTEVSSLKKLDEDLKEKKVDFDLQEKKVETVALALINEQKTSYSLLSMPPELLSLILNWLITDRDASKSCKRVCKIFKSCLETLRDIKNKDILRSGLKSNSSLEGVFNQLEIIENITDMPGSQTLEIVQFTIFRNPKNSFLEVEYYKKRPLPKHQRKNITSVIEEINKEEGEKKRLAKVSDKLYTLLRTSPYESTEGCFDEADRFLLLHDVPGKEYLRLQQFELRLNRLGMWNIYSAHTSGNKVLKPQQKEILELTIKKINAEIKKQLEFAQDMLYSLFRSKTSAIWGKFNKEGLLEILDTQTNQDYKDTFQFKMQKNELEVWELVSNKKAVMTASQQSMLKFIRARFNGLEIIAKEVGVWKELLLKPDNQMTKKAKLFLYEFNPFDPVLPELIN